MYKESCKWWRYKKDVFFVATALALPAFWNGGQVHAAEKQEVSGVQVSQQAGQLVGTVLDENGEPVIGASVLLKGTGTGAVTDVNGHFSVQQISSKTTLVISFVGYLTQEVEAVPGKELRGRGE